MNTIPSLRHLSLAAVLSGLGLLAACTGSGKAPRSSEPVSAPAVAIASNPAPRAPGTGAAVSLRLTTVDGGIFDTATHRGRWLAVNFWATWCHPCLAEMPELSQLDQRRDDIDVVGLAYDDIAPVQLKAFVAAHPVSYPIAQVDVFDPPKAFEAPTGLPTTYLLDPQGKIAKRFVGPVTPREIEQLVDAAKGGAK